MSAKDRHLDGEKDEDELPGYWRQIQGAIWLVGLGILAWQGWWWPGILVLLGISGLFQGAVQLYLSRQNEQAQAVEQQAQAARQQAELEQQRAQQQVELEHTRAAWLPAACPNCGAPLNVSSVQWSAPNAGNCPYCHANLRPPNGAG